MELDEDCVLAKFDCLVEEGVVIYDHNHRRFTQEDEGFSFEFRILSSLTHKPAAGSTSLDQASQSSAYRPGSDISVVGFEVADIGSTHFLAFNKFCAGRPHLLLLTQDGFRRQHESLDMEDIRAALEVISSSKQRYIMLYNCGVAGGCSRQHKHMQLFPAPATSQFELWPDSPDHALDRDIPFKYIFQSFEEESLSSEKVLGAYQALLRQAGKALHLPSLESGHAIPHNVILDKRWILVVPRRAHGINGADANAAAFLGMVWVANDEKLRRWLDQGPSKVLAEVGVPSGLGQSH